MAENREDASDDRELEEAWNFFSFSFNQDWQAIHGTDDPIAVVQKYLSNDVCGLADLENVLAELEELSRDSYKDDVELQEVLLRLGSYWNPGRYKLTHRQLLSRIVEMFRAEIAKR